MNDPFSKYAIPGTRPSPKHSSNKPRPPPISKTSTFTKYLIIGLILLAIVLMAPFLWNFFSNPKKTILEPIDKIEEGNFNNYRLDLGKMGEGVSLNEFVNEELHKLLPGIDLDEKSSVFLSAEISKKMMKLYHEESLNIFKTKVDEYDVHKNILKEKYEKGKSNGFKM